MSDEAGFPWMKLYPSDFRGSAKVQAMSGEEVGYYFLLLLQIWEEGSIPDDPGQLWTICKTTPEKMKRAWPKIRPCMVEHPERDGHLTNPRVEEELGKARERRRRAKAAWEASADARGESDTHKHDAERHAQAGRSSGTQERDGERGGGASLARSDTSVATEASEATDGKEEQKGSEGSSLRSSPSGAEPRVENPPEDDSGPDGEDEPDPAPEKRTNPWGPTVTACQEHLWLDDDPPGDISRGQELSCAGQICDRWNLDPPEMPTLLEGFGRLRDRGFWGEWVEPEEPASLRALNRRPDDEQGIPAVVRCLHEMRKNGSVESDERGGQPEKVRAG